MAKNYEAFILMCKSAARSLRWLVEFRGYPQHCTGEEGDSWGILDYLESTIYIYGSHTVTIACYSLDVNVLRINIEFLVILVFHFVL